MKRTRALVAGMVAATALLAPAAARAATAVAPPAVAPLGTCAQQGFSQPLLGFKDQRFYTLAPGGDFDADTSGWQLSGGAGIVQAGQRAGGTGGVLDLPSGAQATSPPMCITADYPTARLSVRNVTGGDGVFFNVQYYRDGSWTAPKDNGQFHGPGGAAWALSTPMNIQPDKATGWQQVRFTFLAGGKASRFQVDDFWVDPRMRL